MLTILVHYFNRKCFPSDNSVANLGVGKVKLGELDWPLRNIFGSEATKNISAAVDCPRRSAIPM